MFTATIYTTSGTLVLDSSDFFNADALSWDAAYSYCQTYAAFVSQATVLDIHLADA
jgi:hypothetical protein